MIISTTPSPLNNLRNMALLLLYRCANHNIPDVGANHAGEFIRRFRPWTAIVPHTRMGTRRGIMPANSFAAIRP